MGLWDAVKKGADFITTPHQKVFEWATDKWDDYTGKSMNERNIEFQKNENKITRQREDNAIQRRANDMEAAGLNKVLAAGDPASAQALQAPQQGTNPAQMGIQGALGMAQIAKTRAEERALDAKAGVDTQQKHILQTQKEIANALKPTTIQQGVANLEHTKAVNILEKLKAENEQLNIDRGKIQKIHDLIMNNQALADLQKTQKEIIFQQIANRIGLLNEDIRMVDREFSQSTGYSEHIDIDIYERIYTQVKEALGPNVKELKNMSEEELQELRDIGNKELEAMENRNIGSW